MKKNFRKLLGLSIAITMLLSIVTISAHAEGIGYGANNGGNGGTAVTVYNASDLATYAGSSSAYVVTVSGTIDLGTNGILNVGSNTTLQGANTSATILGTVKCSGVSNVIIKYLNISANTGDPGDNDGVQIRGGCSGILVTKCNIYNSTDGNLDVTHGGGTATISWCKFYYTRDNGHNFSNLVGASDDDYGTYNTTWHHNWWAQGCKQRQSATRFGPCHMFNNYWSCSGNDYCTTSRNVCEMLSQNNYYNGVDDPLAKEQSGTLKTSGNIFNNCTGSQTTSNDNVFTPPYSYSLDNASSVPSIVQAGAGNVGGSSSGGSSSGGSSSGGSSSGGLTIQENTTGFCGVDGTVDNNNAGYTGSGFANSDNASGKGVDWMVNFASSDTYTFTFRYANGSTTNRTGRLEINGSTVISNIDFNGTGDWTTWSNTSGVAAVGSGTKSVRLEATNSSGLANIDYIQVTGGTAYAAGCSSSSSGGSSSGGSSSGGSSSGGSSSGGSSSGGPSNGGTYRITARHSGKVLDVANCGTGNGTNIQQWTWLNNDCQKWRTTDVGGGLWRLSPMNATSQAMDVEGWSTSDGGNIFLWAYGGGANQKWQVSSYDGYYRIISDHSGKCLDVEGVSTSDGANIYQWTCSSGQNQQFSFTSAKSIEVAPASFTIFPNPVNAGHFTITLPDKVGGNIEVIVFNLQGKAIYQETGMAKSHLSIECNLAKGIYIIQVKSNNLTLNKKMVVE